MAALMHDNAVRDQYMEQFRRKVELLAEGLAQIDGVDLEPPRGTFYVFPDVREVCNRVGLTSMGLAMYLLEGADDDFGVACLGGEAFGDAGAGFLRFSCAEPDERIQRALRFLPDAFDDQARIDAYVAAHPLYRLRSPY
jgi:aspartate aminotransferase